MENNEVLKQQDRKLLWTAVWFDDRSALYIVNSVQLQALVIEAKFFSLWLFLPFSTTSGFLNTTLHRASIIISDNYQSLPDWESNTNFPVTFAVTRLPAFLERMAYERTCAWWRELDAYALPPASLANWKRRLITQVSLIQESELNALSDSMPKRLKGCFKWL